MFSMAGLTVNFNCNPSKVNFERAWTLLWRIPKSKLTGAVGWGSIKAAWLMDDLELILDKPFFIHWHAPLMLLVISALGRLQVEPRVRERLDMRQQRLDERMKFILQITQLMNERINEYTITHIYTAPVRQEFSERLARSGWTMTKSAVGRGAVACGQLVIHSQQCRLPRNTTHMHHGIKTQCNCEPTGRFCQTSAA